MKARSALSEEEKTRATTLHASGKSVYATARALDRSPHTVKKFLRKPEIVKQVGIQREELAGMFDNVAERTLRSVTPEDVEKASLQQKMVSAGICVDKAALLRGELPSVNVEVLLQIASAIRIEEHRDDPPALPEAQP